MRSYLAVVTATVMCLLAIQVIGFAQITVDTDESSSQARSVSQQLHSSDTRQVENETTLNHGVRQLNDQVTLLLLRESKAANASDRVAAALDIIELSRQIRGNVRYAQSKSIKRVERRLRDRLITVRNRTRSEMRQQRPKKIEIRQEVLAQLNAAAGPNPAAGNAANPQLGNGIQDYGPLLVELIQDTISPASWDVNGGISTIRYWRPGMALVVRAPQPIHDEMAPILLQLRKE